MSLKRSLTKETTAYRSHSAQRRHANAQLNIFCAYILHNRTVHHRNIEENNRRSFVCRASKILFNIVVIFVSRIPFIYFAYRRRRAFVAHFVYNIHLFVQ